MTSSVALGALAVMFVARTALADGGDGSSRAPAPPSRRSCACCRGRPSRCTRTGGSATARRRTRSRASGASSIGSDGTVSNTFERGQVDGKPVTEEELRRAMGVKEEPKEHGDVLTWALAPLSSPATWR